MDMICPVCNEIQKVEITCIKCGGIMLDKGRTQEFSDPYGAEFPIHDSINYCFHTFECDKCNYFQNVKISKIKV